MRLMKNNIMQAEELKIKNPHHYCYVNRFRLQKIKADGKI